VGVDVNAYIDGNRKKKSFIFSREGPVVNDSIPSFIVSLEIIDFDDEADEPRYSDASSFNVAIGIDPLRCAWSSAFGIICKNCI
jgi:hypothetical protein